MNAAGISDVGLVRTNNEDALYFSDTPVYGLPNLFIVADGMGGHKSGEIASEKAIGYFLEFCGNTSAPSEEMLDFMIEGVTWANDKVYHLSLTQPELEGMGTTFTACVYKKDKLYIAHIGDSRIYAIHPAQIRQITVDHTYVNEMLKTGKLTEAEARNHPNRNMLTRALGVEPDVMIDGYIFEPEGKMKILLCSDGLSNMVSDADILAIAAGGGKNQDIAAILTQRARANGGLDNCTVIVFDIGR